MGAVVSIALVVGWIIGICLCVASLALGATIGRDYVFTAPGVSRIGPRVGQRLPSISFAHQGHAVSLGDFLSPDRATFLAFLGSLGRDVDEAHVREILIPDILRVVRLAGGSIKLVVFCLEPCQRMSELLDAKANINVVVLANDDLTTELKVRIAPYALLVDKDTRLLAKGLVNNFEHACRIIVKGGRSSSGKADLERIARLCEPSLPAVLRSGPTVS